MIYGNTFLREEYGYINNLNDIYHNKDKFDSGEINLCFITGLSGSGKSTMANSIKNRDASVENYELDDVFMNFKYSDSELKRLGPAIYSFFKGIGKKYRMTEKPTKENNMLDGKVTEEFEKGMAVDFVNYMIDYAKSHKDKKFIVEGVEIFWHIDPDTINDYAVYIKGTSAFISMIRAAKRQVNKENLEGLDRVNRLFNWTFKKGRIKQYIENDQNFNKWKKYFKK